MKNFNNIFNQIINNKLNTTVNSFPNNYAEFIANKPAQMSDFEWCFSILNPNRFPAWTMQFLYLIQYLSRLFGHSIAFMDKLAFLAKKSTRTIQRALRQLVAVGLVEEVIVENRRLYRLIDTNFNMLTGKYNGDNIIKDFYEETATEDYYTYNSYENDDVTPDVTPPLAVTPLESESKPTFSQANKENFKKIRSLDHQKNDDLLLSDAATVIPESDKKPDQQIDQIVDHNQDQKRSDQGSDQDPNNLITLDQEEREIKEEFEKLTGKPLNLKKNRKPLAELKELAKKSKDLIKLAFQNVAQFIEKTGNKIYNLAYIVTTAKNIMRLENNASKTLPNGYSAASEKEKAYSRIGESTYTESVSVPQEQADADLDQQQLSEDQLVTLACQQDPKLKSTLYSKLTKQEKLAVVEKELHIMEADKDYWESLLEKAQESGGTKFLAYIAVERVKHFLVLSYLRNKESDALQPANSLSPS